MTETPRIVVGADGTRSSLDAVALAAREAAYRELPLHIVHAFIWPLMNVSLGPVPGGPPDSGLRAEALRIVAEALAQAAAHGAPLASSDIIDGIPKWVLLEESADAALVVVGNRGLGVISGAVVGSVGIHLASHTNCPVLIHRGTEPVLPEPVVVGLDGSPACTPTAEFALAEAHLRGTELVAVHATARPDPGDPTGLTDADELSLAGALAGCLERYPDVKVHRKSVRSRAARALVAESARAQLVVVGSQNQRRPPMPRLGSVSAAVVRHSLCPVAVVPHR
jgi:nucleotide-binding universal stress UspA family protein